MEKLKTYIRKNPLKTFFIVLFISYGVLNSILTGSQTNDENTEAKNALKEIAAETSKQIDDAEKDLYESEKYKFNKFKSDKKDPLTIVVKVIQEFKIQDNKLSQKYLNQIALIDIENALADDTFLSGEKINMYIKNTRKLKHLLDNYVGKNKILLSKVKDKLSASLSKKNFKIAVKGMNKSAIYFDNNVRATYHYYKTLEQLLLLAKDMNAKNQFILESGNLVVKDDFYVNEYNNSLGDHNAALTALEKAENDYAKHMKSLIDRIKNI